MNSNAFHLHIMDVVNSIDECLKEKRILPCLILLYSGIDAMAALDASCGEYGRSMFLRWAEARMLGRLPGNITALDLYAARCGVLHTFSPDSDLYRVGKAKRIAYAWGDVDKTLLEISITRLDMTDVLAIHIDELIAAFRNGVADHLEALQNDFELQKRFTRGVGAWFGQIDSQLLENLVGQSSGSEPL